MNIVIYCSIISFYEFHIIFQAYSKSKLGHIAFYIMSTFVIVIICILPPLFAIVLVERKSCDGCGKANQISFQRSRIWNIYAYNKNTWAKVRLCWLCYTCVGFQSDFYYSQLIHTFKGKPSLWLFSLECLQYFNAHRFWKKHCREILPSREIAH